MPEDKNIPLTKKLKTYGNQEEMSVVYSLDEYYEMAEDAKKLEQAVRELGEVITWLRGEAPPSMGPIPYMSYETTQILKELKRAVRYWREQATNKFPG